MKRDYREKTIKGYLTDGTHFCRIPVTVRMTNDDKGKSLSLTAGYSMMGDRIMVGIPLEEVNDIIVLAEGQA